MVTVALPFDEPKHFVGVEVTTGTQVNACVTPTVSDAIAKQPFPSVIATPQEP